MTVLRRVSVGAGILLVVEAAALIAVLVTHGGVELPVTSSLAGTRQQLARVDGLVGAVVLCLIVAVARLLLRRGRIVRWIEFSLTSSITVFLVSQLNGITEITTLVPIYAMTTGMTLLTIVQDRVEVRSGHPMLPLCFGAAIGIVPWGLIAFSQIGAGLAGDAPPVIVRVITLVMLAAALTFAVTHWREQLRLATGGDRLTGERTHIALSIVTTSLFGWLVALGAPGVVAVG